MKLFRSWSILAIFCCLPVVLYSQTNRMVGIKGGYVLSNFWGTGTDNLNSSLREVVSGLDEKNLNWFTVSVFSTRELIPDLFALQSELLYFRGGKSWEGTVGGTKKDLQMSIDYIQMPVLFKVQFPFPLKPSVYVGPQISLMFRSRTDNLPGAVDTTPFFRGTGGDASNGFFNRNTNVVDLGFAAGIDIGIPFGPGNIVVDARYQMGVIDIYSYPAGQKVRNYNFLFMAGYAFNFGGSM
jgi:hypothetical protein